MTVSSELEHRMERLYIGGEWVEADSGETYTRFVPGTDVPSATVQAATEVDARRAVAAARRAFDDGPWRWLPSADRARVLLDAAAILRDRADSVGYLDAAQVGKPLVQAQDDARGAAGLLEYYGGLARTVEGRTVPNTVAGVFGMTVKEPVGVCSIIVPWNFPLIITAQKIAPALAAGCTVILKPSPSTPSSALALAEILDEAGLPPGVLNVVTEKDPGDAVGPVLSTDPGVDKVSFTGSSATGKKVMAAAAASMKRVSLEAGGKSPNIVHKDADLEKAAAGSAFAIFFNAGQICIAGSRLYVHEDVKDDFLPLLAAEAEKLTVGDPFDPSSDLGPIVNDVQEARVRGFLGDASGARFVTGTAEPDNGPYIEPTIVADIPDGARLRSEEVFGPVLAVDTYSDIDDAISRANMSEYGLAAGIWTSSLDTAHRAIAHLRAGTVWVNTYLSTYPELPHGGFKQSGIGRELGPEAMDLYLEDKTVQIKDVTL